MFKQVKFVHSYNFFKGPILNIFVAKLLRPSKVLTSEDSSSPFSSLAITTHMYSDSLAGCRDLARRTIQSYVLYVSNTIQSTADSSTGVLETPFKSHARGSRS